MTFSSWERMIFLVLILATVAIFARDLLVSIRQILAGRPERNRTDQLGRRIVRVIKEVVFQSKVVGGRPIAGLMHAAVFFGFLAFGLETIDHFLEGFGLRFLHPLLGAGVATFVNLVSFMALLVIIGMVGLSIRRFLMPKISPDPKSLSSGLVALFIVLLMVTYLNGISEAPIAGKANWWVHSLIILAFPLLIIRSKHFHIILSPINIFFRTHRLGDYLPLNLDVEQMTDDEEMTLGLEKMSEVPWKMSMDFLTCVECKRCTDACPANSCGQELDPRGFILAGRHMLGEEPESTVIGSVISETALGQCTTCGACEDACPVGIEHLQLLLGAKRAQTLAIGTGMVATDFLQTMEAHGNPFAAAKDVRKELIQDLEIPLYEKGKTDYLLWLGCVWSYNPDSRSGVEALVKVLKQAGVGFGVLENESCSGHHSRRQGEELQFQTLAGENISRFGEHEVQNIITPCPHCLHTIRGEYPGLEDGFSVNVTHHSEFLADLIQRGVIQMKSGNGKNKAVTYHDPCYLGRYENVFDAPRSAIMQSGFELKELKRNKQQSFCCGGGGAGFVREQKTDKRVDQERKSEIAASGAETLITSCPECKMMLRGAVENTQDVAELIAESMLTSGPEA